MTEQTIKESERTGPSIPRYAFLTTDHQQRVETKLDRIIELLEHGATITINNVSAPTPADIAKKVIDILNQSVGSTR